MKIMVVGGGGREHAIIKKLKENKEILFYRQLLSGVLDPDKLDYLNRDAFYCGVPYGIQDTEFTLSALEPDSEKGITINSKSIVAVENLLFSKYLMYRTVYWHKTVRIVTAMMKKTLFSALKNDEISVTVFLVNGVKLQGIITFFDDAMLSL